jgi:hypothetical protein
MKKGFKPDSHEGNCDHGLFETFLLRIESDNPSRAAIVLQSSASVGEFMHLCMSTKGDGFAGTAVLLRQRSRFLSYHSTFSKEAIRVSIPSWPESRNRWFNHNKTSRPRSNSD